MTKRGGRSKGTMSVSSKSRADEREFRQNLNNSNVEDKKSIANAAANKKDQKSQKWSDLDKYIELLLDSKSEEETVFVYLNPNPNGDPYDLLVCSY